LRTIASVVACQTLCECLSDIPKDHADAAAFFNVDIVQFHHMRDTRNPPQGPHLRQDVSLPILRLGGRVLLHC
jgi:hypothetical protein